MGLCFQSEFRTRFDTSEKQTKRYGPEYFSMNVYPLILSRVDPHFSAHALEHLRFAAWRLVPSFWSGLEHERVVAVDCVLATQFEMGAATLERRPSIRKTNELGSFDLVAAMA